jgi:5-methylcytosine-specific restriction enzyme subunit McrC
VLKGQAPVPLTVHAQSSSSLDAAGEVRLRPDVLIRRPGGVALVADCKYKRITAGEHRHQDVYQLLAYCTSLNVSQGLLIYPEHLAPVNTEIVVLNTNVSIREISIDLGGDLPALRAACDALAGLVFANAHDGRLGTAPV